MNDVILMNHSDLGDKNQYVLNRNSTCKIGGKVIWLYIQSHAYEVYQEIPVKERVM